MLEMVFIHLLPGSGNRAASNSLIAGTNNYGASNSLIVRSR